MELVLVVVLFIFFVGATVQMTQTTFILCII